VKARVRLDVHLEAERGRRQTDLQVGMPENYLVPSHRACGPTSNTGLNFISLAPWKGHSSRRILLHLCWSKPQDAPRRTASTSLFPNRYRAIDGVVTTRRQGKRHFSGWFHLSAAPLSCWDSRWRGRIAPRLTGRDNDRPFERWGTMEVWIQLLELTKSDCWLRTTTRSSGMGCRPRIEASLT